MRFFEKKYLKLLSISIFFGGLVLFLVKNSVWAAESSFRPTASSSPVVQQPPIINKVPIAPQQEKPSLLPAEKFVQPVKEKRAQSVVMDKKNSIRTIRKQALEQKQDVQAKHYGVDTKPLSEIENENGINKYTQSEAHLQVKKVRDIIASKSSTIIVPYLDTISDCLVREAELKNTHYVFYHTTENAWRVTQDLESQLYAYFKENGKVAGSEFTFLRFNDPAGPQAKDFLVSELQHSGLVDDSTREVAAILLSVNLALFGNIGFEAECTWEYFLREKKHREPDRATYEAIMDKYKLSYKYIDDLLRLPELFQTKEKTILQIFVPKDKVDQIGYLAWATGVPAHAEIHKWAREYVRNKKWKPGEKKSDLWSTQWLALNFKEEQEKNPLFKELMDNVKAGDFSLDAFLKIYCNKPWELPNINDVQARLIFSPDVLLNPNSGVKIYRHATARRKKLEEYSKRLNEIVEQIINEKTKTAA